MTDVVLVRWPVDDERRVLLALRQIPRLLLVEQGGELPNVVDPLEDWVRVPADEREIQARLETLAARVRDTRSEAPALDDGGVLRYGGSWASLPPVELRLAEALLARFGAVVSRDALGSAAWPEGMPGRNALDVHVLRLRRRVEPLGLAIKTVRSRGYLFEAGAHRKSA